MLPSIHRFCGEKSYTAILHSFSYVTWLRSTVGGTPVFGRRTDPVLRSTFS